MGLTVLSLFDGCSGGLQALIEEGFEVDAYYASEIDKFAISVSKYNHEPTVIHIGDVQKVRYENGILYTEKGNFKVDKFDMIIGGSPCTDFSVAGTGRGMSTSDLTEIHNLEQYLQLKDAGFKFAGQSYLFWEYVRLRKETQAKYFFLENVRMVEKWKRILSDNVGAEPVMLNSALVSAQNRVRFYWTNIPGYEEPQDEGILLKHIVHENTERAVKLTERNLRHFRGEGEKGLCCTATMYKGAGNNGTTLVFEETDRYEILMDVPEATKKGFTSVKVGEGVDLTFLNSKTRRGRRMEDKSNCLTAANYEYNMVEELRKYIVPFDKTLQILEKEVEKGKVGYFRKDSQANRVYFIHGKAVTLCGEAGGGAAKMGQYLFGVITPDRVEKRQNGQVSNEGQKFYTLTSQGKHGILIEGYIRKLTPIECERLQTLPDGYTAKGIVDGKIVDVSDSQRYKMLGNGWTTKAIRAFFKHLPYKRNK